jgi:ParB family chromosome partitioning protein
VDRVEEGLIMSIKDRLANKSASVGMTPRTGLEQPPSGKPKTGAGQLMQSLPMLAEKDDEIANLKRQLDDARESAAALEIPLSELKEVPGRRRKLTQEQFVELRENLRNNPLISAITVRLGPEGGYEIISGHNRVAAFRALNKEKILAVVIDTGDAESELGAFYANLLQADLPDYEKYLGFKRRRDATGKNTTQLAAEAGVSTTFVHQLMSFEKLPLQVIALLDERPHLVGANAAEDFAKLAQGGRLDEVLAAVQQIAEAGITQAAALRLAAKADRPTARAEVVKIKAGRAVFAEVRAAHKTLRIAFRSAEERETVSKAIEDVIRQFAAKKWKPE